APARGLRSGRPRARPAGRARARLCPCGAAPGRRERVARRARPAHRRARGGPERRRGGGWMSPRTRKDRHLVIVESPAKARTIKRYLGPGYEVAASVGHIRDLPPKELGVDVDAGFEPKYVTIHGKGKVIQELKRKAKDADAVLLATDPDREGEAIAYHV